MISENLKVSIIVPIYNVEEYISNCINSIINQTYKNIEIILVNDGSPDNSKSICEYYKKRDERVIIVNKENGGLSSARNEGIKVASGDYIMFVDGDDWIDLNCVEECIKALDNDTEVILFPYIREYKNKSIKNEIFESDKINFCNNEVRENILKRLFGIQNKELRKPDRLEDLSTAWGKLYKKSVIDGKEFVDTKIIGTEDAWFNINVFINVNSAKFIKYTYYHYYKENETSLTKKYNPYLFERWKKLYQYMEQFIYDNALSNDFICCLDNRKIINLLALNRNIVNSNLKFNEKIREMKTILSSNIYKDSFDKFSFNYMSLKWRAFYKACYLKKYYSVYIITIMAEKLKKIIG